MSESTQSHLHASLRLPSPGFVALVLGVASLLGAGILALCVELEVLVGESVLNVALSFALGFVGNVAIVASSFLALLKQVEAHISESSPEATSQADSKACADSETPVDSEISESSAAEDGAPEDGAGEPRDEPSQKGGFVSRFLVGTRLSVSFLRIVSFGGFGGVLIWLLMSDRVVIFALFTGLVCALCALCGIGLRIVGGTKVSKKAKM